VSGAAAHQMGGEQRAKQIERPGKRRLISVRNPSGIALRPAVTLMPEEWFEDRVLYHIELLTE
jgi:hypothetical protein